MILHRLGRQSWDTRMIAIAALVVVVAIVVIVFVV